MVIRMTPSIYKNSLDVVLYKITDKDIIRWFQMVDIWGGKGYDRFNDGGIYFEIPIELKDIIPKLRFVVENHIYIGNLDDLT